MTVTAHYVNATYRYAYIVILKLLRLIWTANQLLAKISGANVSEYCFITIPYKWDDIHSRPKVWHHSKNSIKLTMMYNIWLRNENNILFNFLGWIWYIWQSFDTRIYSEHMLSKNSNISPVIHINRCQTFGHECIYNNNM